VIGVVEAFEQLGKQSTVVGKAAAAGAPQEVMAAIAEALVATAVGLAVAIPAVAAYNYYQRLSKSVLANTSALSHVLLSYLVAPPAPVLASPKAEKGRAGKPAASDTEEEA
jgi:biopolymer transport protein ExbB